MVTDLKIKYSKPELKSYFEIAKAGMKIAEAQVQEDEIKNPDGLTNLERGYHGLHTSFSKITVNGDSFNKFMEKSMGVDPEAVTKAMVKEGWIKTSYRPVSPQIMLTADWEKDRAAKKAANPGRVVKERVNVKDTLAALLEVLH